MRGERGREEEEERRKGRRKKMTKEEKITPEGKVKAKKGR